jgi:Flp pilus assembly protein TadG
MKTNPVRLAITGFLRDEKGSGTVFGMMLLVTFIAFGGMSIDIQNAITERTHLQMASDSAAHAAILTREFGSVEEARTAALAMSTANMPVDLSGNVVTEDSIFFGYWDPETKTFVEDDDSRAGVRVVARETEVNENPVATFMLWMVGFDQWDVAAATTYVTYHPTCLRDGFVAQSYVDLQSNNNYFNGFCIHSNDHVELNQNNYFEAGTTVSMPDLSDLEIPASGFDKNEGLEEALIEGEWNIRIVNRIDAIIAGVKTTNSIYTPSYITANSAIIALADNNIGAGEVTQGRVHTYTCSGKGNDTSLTISTDLDRVVIVTNCLVNFGSNRNIEDTVIATTHTGSKSIQGASGLVLGNVDNCVAGGEVQLVTLGSFYTTASMSSYGSQILAKNNITFSALGEGSKGISLVAGGYISGTSNMNMNRCGNDDTENFQASYFTMVE